MIVALPMNIVQPHSNQFKSNETKRLEENAFFFCIHFRFLKIWKKNNQGIQPKSMHTFYSFYRIALSNEYDKCKTIAVDRFYFFFAFLKWSIYVWIKSVDGWCYDKKIANPLLLIGIGWNNFSHKVQNKMRKYIIHSMFVLFIVHVIILHQ